MTDQTTQERGDLNALVAALAVVSTLLAQAQAREAEAARPDPPAPLDRIIDRHQREMLDGLGVVGDEVQHREKYGKPPPAPGCPCVGPESCARCAPTPVPPYPANLLAHVYGAIGARYSDCDPGTAVARMEEMCGATISRRTLAPEDRPEEQLREIRDALGDAIATRGLPDRVRKLKAELESTEKARERQLDMFEQVTNALGVVEGVNRADLLGKAKALRERLDLIAQLVSFKNVGEVDEGSLG